ncbi:MAG: RnfABCDGE type electron transport complex subunit D [Bacteroidales bacterium]|nr:RnfABCDGE type electron transport complex subunit D [Bacteroidales bacterium]MCF8386371.1 RnfABCDGE type electron transport complex subunit D [Bacteroidales bacterium]MCF8396787.1 RnfABCDGE type electron transport complex subunit D [Bacteroidales bacterium]
MGLLTISGSPHVHGDMSVKKIMYGVVYAMIPAILVSVYFFGLDALRVILISVAACLFFEWFIQKYIIKGPITIDDGSAVVAGVLLAFNVPANLPVWIILIGAFVTIGIAKMSFGGLGKNPFNPALVGRIFLLISFPVQMTTWPIPKPLFQRGLTDAITGPTPLGFVKEGLKTGKTVPELMEQVPSYMQELVGDTGGSLGEISAIALVLGALYMLYRRIITWEIPVSYLLSVFVFTGILWLIDPTIYINPLFHLIAGGLMLGVFYMATDMVSSPMSSKGQLVFGVGCGLITVIIRIWGAYPEGVAFAILIMNAFAPLINRVFKPKRFGEVVKN